jgi:two-component system phosphate regulon response regulator OmpR
LTRGRERSPFDRTVDSQIARLRKKLEASPSASRLIGTVRGVGYVFVGQVDAREPEAS